ncbi:hypothetical protein ACSBR2_042389 [Camellia fascicularis]
MDKEIIPCEPYIEQKPSEVDEKWRSNFQRTNIKNISLLEYVSLHGDVSLYSINEVWNERNILVSHDYHRISWLMIGTVNLDVQQTNFLYQKHHKKLFSYIQRSTQ